LVAGVRGLRIAGWLVARVALCRIARVAGWLIAGVGCLGIR